MTQLLDEAFEGLWKFTMRKRSSNLSKRNGQSERLMAWKPSRMPLLDAAFPSRTEFCILSGYYPPLNDHRFLKKCSKYIVFGISIGLHCRLSERCLLSLGPTFSSTARSIRIWKFAPVPCVSSILSRINAYAPECYQLCAPLLPPRDY